MKTSKNWVVQNKCSTPKFKSDWLVFCRNWYSEKIDTKKVLKSYCLDCKYHEHWHYIYPYKMDQIIWLYDYSFKHGYTNLYFDTFKAVVRGESYSYDNVQGYTKRKRKYLKHSGMKYQKIKGKVHGMKNREQTEAKKLWREVSGKDRDHKKKGKKFSYDHPRIFSKKQRTQKHRNWIKRQLCKENYDAFHSKERTIFEGDDIWGW